MTSARRSPSSGKRNQPGPSDGQPSGVLGVVLVAVAVALGVILLVKGGGIGFENDKKNVAIGKNNTGGATVTTSTAAPAPATSVPASELKIAVLNGAGKSGFAGQGANFLSVAGYPAVTPGNSAATVQASTVYFAPGFENDAAAVAKVLKIADVKPIPASPALGKAPADVPSGTAVVVVLGPDAEAVISAPNTTTTAAPTTTGA